MPKKATTLAFVSALGLTFLVSGCEADDAAAHEPNAKSQKIILDAGSSSDSSSPKEQWDEKQPNQDEVSYAK